MSQQLTVAFHSDQRCYFLYLPAGFSKEDGAPLSFATPLTAEETRLWQQGEKEALARALRSRGIPLPVGDSKKERRWWRRFLDGLLRKLSGSVFPEKPN